MLHSDIKKPYGITLVGFEPPLVLRPLAAQIPPVKSMILFHSDHPRSLSTRDIVIKTTFQMGIDSYAHGLNDVFNFFEIFMATEFIRSKFGNPTWINTTAGPGIGASALSLFASMHNIDLIAYDREKDRTRVVPIVKLKDLFKCQERYLETLKEINDRGECSFEDLGSKLLKSKPTLSWQIKLFRELNLIEIRGSGRGYSPYRIKLTTWGQQFLRYALPLSLTKNPSIIQE